MILLEEVLAGAAATHARVVGDVYSREFEDFAYDSRNVRGGELFVAVRTGRADGHDFIAAACSRGAAGVLCERPPDAALLRAAGATCVAVDDVRRALREWARYVLRRQAPRVIAVTGSVGKTCTTGAIAAVLRHLGGDPRAVFDNDNYNDLFGLPISLGRLAPAHQTAALELASDSSGEIAALCEVTAPHVAVVTNVAPAHLEHFGSLERLAAEYGALPAAAAERVCLNRDDPRVAAMARRARAPVTWFGLDERADVRASGVRTDVAVEWDQPEVGRCRRRFPLAFRLHWRGASAEVRLQLIGRHNVYTALAAAAVALAEGYELPEVAAALAEVEAPAGRLRPLAGVFGASVLDDSFSASVPSTLAALDALAAGRPPRIAVLGEVSGAAADGYGAIGRAAARGADYLLAVGDTAEAAVRAAAEAGLPAERTAVTHTVEDTAAQVRAWAMSPHPPAPSASGGGGEWWSTGGAATSRSPGRADRGEEAQAARGTRLGSGGRGAILVKGSEAARLERVVERLLDDPEAHAGLLVRQAPGAKQVVPLHQDRAAWMEVDLGAIAHNLRRLRAIAAPAEVMAVLKADAYGHGAVRVARTAMHHGAAMLGTAVLSEAATLRAHGITAPVLVLGYTPPWQARDVVRLGVAASVFSLDLAQHLSQAALALERPPVPVHLKVDTGMHRLGLLPYEVVPFARAAAALPGVRIEGVFTHFATADAADPAYALEQLRRFERVLAEWRAAGLPWPRYVHAANSAATLRLPQARFNLVRVGVALYGLHPSAAVPCPPELRPALALKTQLAQVKDLPAGEPVSYGGAWVTPRESRIGVLPIGYADGFRRGPENWGEVLVRGRRAPVVGRVCMDMSMVDVTDVPGARAGDEVVLIGEQGGARLTAEDVAARLGTINYEVVSQILARVPREIVSR